MNTTSEANGSDGYAVAAATLLIERIRSGTLVEVLIVERHSDGTVSHLVLDSESLKTKQS